MTNPKISVIIPVYNVEPYLEYCLESILNQTMIEDIEVLMIDNGSTDNSRYIIENYALDYDNFFAFHQENKGQGIARNFGLRKARGEYIHFMDSDDYLKDDAYERLYEFGVKNNNDFVMCGVSKFTENTIWDDVIFRNLFKNISSDIPSTNIRTMNDLVWDTIATNKLYKKEFLDKNQIRFIKKKIVFEDIIFSFQAHYSADSIGIINERFYFWRFRSNMASTTQGLSNITNIENRFVILKLLYKYMADNVREKKIFYAQYLKWLRHDFLLYLKRIDELPSKYHQKLIEHIQYFLNIIPNDFRLKLNGYNQLLYYQVENNNFNDLLNISHLDSGLIEDMANQDIYIQNKEYVSFFNSIEFEELIGELVKLNANDEYLIMDLKVFIQFIPKTKNDCIVFKLIKDNREYDLHFTTENSLFKLFVPLNLIDINASKIKIIYNVGGYTKTAILKTENRFVVKFHSLEYNLAKIQNREMILFSRKINDNKIEITHAQIQDESLFLDFKCDEEFDSLSVVHLIDLDLKLYEVYSSNDKLTVKIPFKDLISKHINKWELMPVVEFNYIKYDYIDLFWKNFHIKFHNQRNRVVINIKNYKINNLINEYEDNLDSIKDNIKFLENENNKLNKNNDDLKNTCEEFKARKSVRLADRLHMK